MAENEGLEFAGEAGVFPSLLPDNAPSGAGELLATDSLPTGEQTLAERLTGKNGMGWELGSGRGGRHYARQNNKVKTCVEGGKHQRAGRERAPGSSDFKISRRFPHFEVRYEEFKATSWKSNVEILILILMLL